MTYTTDSPESTYNLGEKLASQIKPGQFISLVGGLGSGKTTFAKGFAHGLGVGRHVTSPTFLIIKSYNTKREEVKKLYHLDLYRLDSESDLEGIGILDVLKDKSGVVLVEWAEKMGGLLPENRLEIEFEYVDNNRRRIEVSES